MLEESVRYIKGVGPHKEKLLNKLGVFYLRDLFYYFPFRYEDRTNPVQIKDLSADEPALVKGKVLARNFKPFKSRPWAGKSGKNVIFEIALADDSGVIKCVWFHQGYLKDKIKVNDQLFVYGKPRFYRGQMQLVAPEFSFCCSDADYLNLGRIVGFYHLTQGLTQNFLRKLINDCLVAHKDKLEDPIPFRVRKDISIDNIVRSLQQIHFPDLLKKAAAARRRFIFEELFFAQILVYLRKANYRFQKSVAFIGGDKATEALKQKIPFSLTAAQQKVVDEIIADLGKKRPMHRLLQGDVGSGKTIVACFAINIVVSGRYQAAIMAPTEVLAQQHYRSLRKIFKAFNFNIALLTSSTTNRRKKEIYQNLASGEIDIIIGTHALLSANIEFHKLGLVIIDEQHKFGVAQRTLLPKKGQGVVAHCLVMSATPIPRSLALSFYGDLDLSIIDQLPPGRKQPRTYWVNNRRRRWVYDFMRQHLNQGRQAYVVYPLIEATSDWDLKSLTEMEEVLRHEFKNFRVGIFHGRLKAGEKNKVVQQFRDHNIDILIATTVIEVGVNIENATVMVVENPERFGLAQLHQLRGRIRRSSYQPHFILLSEENIGLQGQERLEVISNTDDGFKIAEEDLKLRGPGDFFGNLQSGYPDLKIANPIRDLKLLQTARQYAYKVIKQDPNLENRVNLPIRKHLSFYFNQDRGSNEDSKGRT